VSHSKHTTYYGPYCNLTTSYPTERDDKLIIVLMLQMMYIACGSVSLSKHTTHYGPYCNLTTSYPTERDDELIIVLMLQMMYLACWERATL
jgi:hypothetical protein